MKNAQHNPMHWALALLFANLILVSPLWAQKTWDGGAMTSNWNDGDNWNPNGVPAASEDVIFNTSVAVVVDVTPPTLSSLTISGSANVTFTSSGGGRTITLSNPGTALTIESGSSVTLIGSTGSGTRSMRIAFSGAGNIALIDGTLVLTNAGDGTGYIATNSATFVSGALKNDGSYGGTNATLTSTAANLAFESNGTFIHARNGGNIPTATWVDNATCEVTGRVNSNIGGLNQSFVNIKWNCTAQTNNQTIPSMTLSGNFEIVSSGVGQLRMNQNTPLTVGGNFIQSGGFFRIANGNSDRTLAVNGNFSMSGGTLEMAQGGGNGIGTLTVKGNFSYSAGTITESNTGTGAGSFVFNGTGTTQVFTAIPAFTNSINFTINNTAVVDFGASVISGSTGTFSLNSGAKIITSNAAGLDPNGTVQSTGLKTFSSGANYEFKGAKTGIFITTPIANSVNNLIINSPGGIILSMPVAVHGACTFSSGILTTTSTELLTINDNASVSGASGASFVNGPVQKRGNDAFSFPTGKSGTYAPISISAPETLPGILTDAFIAEYFSGTPTAASLGAGIDHISSLEYWTLSRSNGTTNNVKVTLSWRSSSAVTDKDFLLITRYDGMNWVNHPATAIGDATSGTITTTGFLSAFSPFTLASSVALPTNPLPVELLYFNASVTGSNVLLEWSTATESDNDFFVVEKTKDGVNFEEVAKIDGAGTSTFIQKYQALDESPYPGTSYYRLKQVDYSSHFSYSELAEVSFAAFGFTWDVFPNPTYDRVVNVAISSAAAGDIELSLVDMSGRIYFRTKISGEKAGTGLPLSLPADITPGAYVLVASNNNAILGHKSLIIK